MRTFCTTTAMMRVEGFSLVLIQIYLRTGETLQSNLNADILSQLFIGKTGRILQKS